MKSLTVQVGNADDIGDARAAGNLDAYLRECASDILGDAPRDIRMGVEFPPPVSYSVDALTETITFSGASADLQAISAMLSTAPDCYVTEIY
jgi:hypothetical protein